MEIFATQVVASGFFFLLLLYLLLHWKKVDKFLLVAVALSFYANLHTVVNYLIANSSTYYINPQGNLLMYFGWLIYLQSQYLTIPGITRLKRFISLSSFVFILGLSLFRFQFESKTEVEYLDIGTYSLSTFFLSVIMLFYLENIIRYLKAGRRYHSKHLFFVLGIFAFILFLNSYFSLIFDVNFKQLYHLGILIHLLLPVFMIVSVHRMFNFHEIEFDTMKAGMETQYLMVFIGIGVFLIGTLETIRLFINEFEYEFVSAIFTLLVIGLGGAFVLSNGFRSILVSAFRSYFYRDKNDYKLEWEKINSIVGNEDDIYDEILNYYLDWSGKSQGALYLYKDNQELSLVAGSGAYAPQNTISEILPILQGVENLYNLDLESGDAPTLCIRLSIDKITVGWCLLPKFGKLKDIDDASKSLCNTASTAFAIRLRDLDQKRLILRQEKMAGFNRTVAFLAHDLKNIAAQQQLALENYPNNKNDVEFLDDFNETIEHSTSRLMKIIDQFHLSAKPVRQNSQLIVLGSFLSDIQKQANRLSSAIIFNVDIPDVNYYVDIRLITIVFNLVKNAVEASKANSSIHVSCSANDLNLQIDVTDTGKGMTQKFIDNYLFEPFVSQKGEYGLGIGMYQVREIVRDINGEISVKSKPGEGTTVALKVLLREGI